MKVLLILAALAGLTLAAPSPTVKALPDDFDELLALIPWADITVLALEHIETDPEFNQVLTYLQSPEWDALVQYVRDHPTYQNLKAFCLEKGVDLEAVAQAIHDFIHSLTPGPDTGDATLRQFLDALIALISWDDISAWLDDKMTNSEDFIELYGVASSDDMYAMVEEVRALPEVQRIAAVLEAMGVRLDEVLALVYEFFGWPAPGLKTVKALPDDFDELLALIPWADITVLALEHIETDPEFNQVLTYLQSPEWDALVQYVRDHPTYQNLKAFCLEKGVDLEAVAQAIHDFIHSLTPGPDTGDATLRQFLDALIALISWDDISAWLDDKMTNSEDFIELYGVASSDDMYAMVEEVRALPEVQRIAAVLEAMGVRLDEVLAMVYEFFGWPAPGLKAVKALPDDFDELLALIPWADITVLVLEHIETDPEFNQVLTYLQTPEWDAIVQYVRDHPTYQNLKAFCLEKGVDLEAVAQAIHDFIHSLTPGPDTGDATLRQFLDALIALISWDDISAWLDDKMTNSEDFIELYGVASSDDMYAMVEEVRALPEVQRIAAVLEAMGVRLDEVLAMVYEFFGWPAPGLKAVKALPDDFDELLALIPWADITVLVLEHIETDPEFNQVLTYLQTPEWDAIVQYVRDHPTYQNLKAFCLEKGVDLEAVAQAIHDFIHSLTPGPDTGDATLRQFLDALIALISWDDISAWLDDKMTNSEDFIELYGVASSDDMYAMVEEVRALPEVQRIAAILEEMGVRVEEVLAMVYEFFGWPAP